MHTPQKRTLAALVIVALIGAAAGLLFSARFRLQDRGEADSDPEGPSALEPLPVTPTSTATTAAPSHGLAVENVAPTLQPVSFVKLAKDLSPAVLHVSTLARNPFTGELVERGQGTGFVISADGYALTNNHVVAQSRSIQVRLHDERTLPAEVVGADPDTDIAVIHIKSDAPLATAPLGDSDALEVGEWVVAIGNPLGLDHSVTAGIVSAKGRRDIAPGGMRSPYYDFIQTDASINPGNSGGPLINLAGQVVGINSAVSSQGQGIGFSIPINMARTLVPLLQKYGRVPRSFIGVSVTGVTEADKIRLGLANTRGALVASVQPGSPAQRFGLVAGDVILEFDHKPVHNKGDLSWLASIAGIGRTVSIVVAREPGRTREIRLTLEEKPR